jgi:hypothetical protein
MRSCPPACPDADHDGATSETCGGTDCDDADPDRHPGNTEVCDPGHDEDCDPTTFGTRDADHDGHVDAMCCNGTTCGDDCDDTVPSIYGGAPETCDDLDDDCDMAVDEMLAQQTYARDCDGDGFGEIMGMTVMRCAPPPPLPMCMGWSTMPTDCNDMLASANPANGESCDDIDNDCDGIVDEGIGGTSLRMNCYADMDNDGLAPAMATITTVCTSTCPPFNTPVAPVDAAHTDCDDANAAVHDLVAGRTDADGDHVGGADAMGCPTGDPHFIPAATGTRDCDDGNASIFPGQTAFFPTPTGRGCLDATYSINCGNGTCGRLNSSCCPPITLPTCGTADVRPVQDLWNYDCDPHPTAPAHADGCGSCGMCSGGYVYTDTSQCGASVSYQTCTNACSLIAVHFCNLNMTDTRTLPCR